jgi:hypothetical protein
MKRSTLLLVLLAGSYVIAGLLEPLSLPRGEVYSPYTLVHALVGAVLIYAWCRAHSQERQTSPPVGAAILSAFLPPIGLPYYMLRSYPFPRAAFGIGKAIAFFALSLALFYGAL